MAVFALGSLVSAQSPAADSLPALQQSVAQRTAEWNALASNLEQRVARLLPCDPQARAAIDDAGRASDARTQALVKYWTVASLQSKAQIDTIRDLVAQEQDRAGDRAVEVSEAHLDIDLTVAEATTLTSSVRQLPALAAPQKHLQNIVEQYRSAEKQVQARALVSDSLLADLRELLNAGQTRQAAIEERLKAAIAEGQRWNYYYAARLARTQVECFLINPAGGAVPAAPRPAPQGKKQ
jgi:hypothetical protein